ncbi:hypothetical protein BN946_scf185016.g106 [Trametes cinnabarina]|uniref:Uncharacterized protein n=1 Tax=Pycnoporus cinnabarinus TaxID=5643 RepID=A0A060SNZ9_PYCCI|nr:hypothetical protein BN946_scf185016.g106 [Trametes cinnabarina]
MSACRPASKKRKATDTAQRTVAAAPAPAEAAVEPDAVPRKKARKPAVPVDASKSGSGIQRKKSLNGPAKGKDVAEPSTAARKAPSAPQVSVKKAAVTQEHRKARRPPLMDYEAILSASPKEAVQVITQPVLTLSVPTARTEHEPPAKSGTKDADDGEDEIDDEGDPSGGSQYDDEDDPEASESDDDVLVNSATIEADLAAERPVWTNSKQSSFSKGKETVRASTDDEDSNSPSDPGDAEDSGEDEYVEEPALVDMTADMSSKSDDNDTSEETHGEVSAQGVAGMKPNHGTPSRGAAAAVAYKKKGPSKRDKKHALEQPVWIDNTPAGSSAALSPLQLHPTVLPSAVATTPPIRTVTPPSLPAHVPLPAAAPPHAAPPLAQDNNAIHAAAYDLVPPPTVGAVLPLSVQHPHIQIMLREAFPRIEAELCFTNAFPSTLGRSQFVVKAMVSAASALEHRVLERRLQQDSLFTRLLSAIVGPNQRVSSFRSGVKKITDAHVAAFYNLQATPGECDKKVEWLFEHLAYLYPSDMHASLTEWKSGTHKACAFSGDSFIDVYNEQVLLLTGIREQNVHGYHTMTHRLYNAVLGITPTANVTSREVFPDDGHLARPLGTETERSKSIAGTFFEKRRRDSDKKIIERVQQLAGKKGWTMSQVALSWVTSKITAPIVGANTPERLQQSIVRGKTLTPDEIKFLEEP